MSTTSPGSYGRFSCEISGCDADGAMYPVTLENLTRRVCVRCMQEMVAVYGWSLDWATVQAARARSA